MCSTLWTHEVAGYRHHFLIILETTQPSACGLQLRALYFDLHIFFCDFRIFLHPLSARPSPAQGRNASPKRERRCLREWRS